MMNKLFSYLKEVSHLNHQFDDDFIFYMINLVDDDDKVFIKNEGQINLDFDNEINSTSKSTFKFSLITISYYL